MTVDKKLKAAVRQRRTETGEPYSEARNQILKDVASNSPTKDSAEAVLASNVAAVESIQCSNISRVIKNRVSDFILAEIKGADAGRSVPPQDKRIIHVVVPNHKDDTFLKYARDSIKRTIDEEYHGFQFPSVENFTEVDWSTKYFTETSKILMFGIFELSNNPQNSSNIMAAVRYNERTWAIVVSTAHEASQFGPSQMDEFGMSPANVETVEINI